MADTSSKPNRRDAFKKVLEQKKPGQQQAQVNKTLEQSQKTNQEILDTIQTGQALSEEQLNALLAIQSSSSNQEAAAELSVSELNDINTKTSDVIDAIQDAQAANEELIRGQVESQELVSDIRSEEHREQLAAFNDVQAAVKSISKDADFSKLNFNNQQGVKLPGLPAIKTPLPEPEKPEDDKASEMLPKETKSQEIGKSSMVNNMIQQLRTINGTLTGMAGSLTQLIFQMGLQTIKMASMIGIGLLAADLIINGVKVVIEKYGAQIESTLTKMGESFKEGWEKAKELLPIEELKKAFENVYDLFQDFQNGSLIEGLVYGFKDHLKNLFSLFSRAFEGIFRAIGFDGTADEVVASRVEMNNARGVASSDTDTAIWAKVKSEDQPTELEAKAKAYTQVMQEYSNDPKMVDKSGWINKLTDAGKAEVEKRASEFKQPKTKEQLLADQKIELAIGKARDAMADFESDSRSQGQVNRMERAQKFLETATGTLTPEQKTKYQAQISEIQENMQKNISVIKRNQEEHAAERSEIEGGSGSEQKNPSIKTKTASPEVDANIKAIQDAEAAKVQATKNEQSVAVANVQNNKSSTTVVMAPVSSITGIQLVA